MPISIQVAPAARTADPRHHPAPDLDRKLPGPDDTDVLSGAEQRLLPEWLTRLAADDGAPQS